MLYRNDFKTKQEARSAIAEWIGVFYNHQRYHSTIGYVTPVGFEESYYAMSNADKKERASRTRRSIINATPLGSFWVCFVGILMLGGGRLAASVLDVPTATADIGFVGGLFGLLLLYLALLRPLSLALDRRRLTKLPFRFSFNSYASALGYRRTRTKIRLRVSFQRPVPQGDRARILALAEGIARQTRARFDDDKLVITQTMKTKQKLASGQGDRDDAQNDRVHRFVRRALLRSLVNVHKLQPIDRVTSKLSEIDE